MLAVFAATTKPFLEKILNIKYTRLYYYVNGWKLD